MTKYKVAVVGAGGWGTALAVMLARKGQPVLMWARRTDQAAKLQRDRVNEEYLPGVVLPPTINVTSELTDLVDCTHLLLAVPSQALRETWKTLASLLNENHRVANTAKGLEISTGKRLFHVLCEERGQVPQDGLAVLSGPNHAEEVGMGLPTTSVISSYCSDTAEEWQDILMGPDFRVYTNDDVIGVELGGALKNVIALAAGICDGLGFGDNTKAALLTRGLAEMTRLGVALGAKPLTFSGLSGMGDLIATCTSRHSRNARAGRAIGQGQSAQQVVEESAMVIEGIPTCRAALGLAKSHGVEMPITQAVWDVLYDQKPPQEAVRQLMVRGPKGELDAILGS